MKRVVLPIVGLSHPAAVMIRFVAACALALALTTCAHLTRVPQNSGTNTLTVAIAREPIALDPLLEEGVDAHIFSELLFSYLTNYDSSGRVVGDVALEAPSRQNGGIARDGRQLTFHLRHNVRWQDGATLTARDVIFTYHAIMNPANNVPTRFGYDRIGSIVAPDPYTVRITMKRPYSPILSSFFGGDSNYPILPAHLLARATSLNNAAFSAAPVGTGPYRLERWERGDRLVLRANASYYAGRPHIGRLILPVVPNGSTVIDQLQSGELDAAFLLDASRMRQLRTIARHRVVVTPVPYFYALGFNLDDPILRDLTVRRAFALAIDRRNLTRKLTDGVYNADTAMRGLFTWAYDPSVHGPSYDPARAQALLTKDGWIRNGSAVRSKNGRPLHVEISFPTGSGITTRFATAIAAAEHTIGIDVTLHQYDRIEFVSVQGPWTQKRYQVSLYDYQADYDPDASWLLACDQRAPYGFNDTDYCDARVDTMLARGASSYERRTRRAAYAEVQRRIAEQLPLVFLCQISEVDVVPENLRGFRPPLLSPFTSVASWRRSRLERRRTLP